MEASGSGENDSNEPQKEFIPVSKKMFVKLNNNCITEAISYTLSLYEEIDTSSTTKRLNEVTLDALCMETQNLKRLGIMNVLPNDNLFKLLKILEVNIRGGASSSYSDEVRIDRKYLKKIMVKASSCVVALNVLNSPKMPKKFYTEQMLELICSFSIKALQNVIIPWLNAKRRVTYQTEAYERKIIPIIGKVVQVIDLLADLLEAHKFPGHLPVELISLIVKQDLLKESNFLQKPSIKLMATTFRCFEGFRLDIINEIFNDTRGLSSQKNYVLKSGESVRVSTVLFFELIQNIALPNVDCRKKSELVEKLQDANMYVTHFLNMFLNKYSNALGDYKIYFENFLDDVFVLCNKPDFPAAEEVLKLCQQEFADVLVKPVADMCLLKASLEYSSKISISILRFKSNFSTIEVSLHNLFGCKDQELSKSELEEEARKMLVRFLDKAGNKGAKSYFILSNSCSKSRNSKKKTSKNSFMMDAYWNNVEFDTCPEYRDALLCKSYLLGRRIGVIFEQALSTIFDGLSDAVVALRIKSLKCLATLIQTDNNLLEREDVKGQLKLSFADESPAVRESSLDLLAKSISTSSLLDRYYNLLLSKIFDSGLGVRIRAMRVFCEICHSHPDFEKLPEVFYRILKKFDEDEIKGSFILEAVEKLWFPSRLEDTNQKVENIVKVIDYADDAITYFENTMRKLVEAKIGYSDFKKSCEHLIVYLVVQVTNAKLESQDAKIAKYWSVLYVFSKIQPELFLVHTKKFQMLLRSDEFQPNLMEYTLNVLTNMIPFIEPKEKSLISFLEEKLTFYCVQKITPIIYASSHLLSLVIYKFSNNFKIVRDMFKLFYNYLIAYKNGVDVSDIPEERQRNITYRSIYILGVLLKFFDFKDTRMAEDLTIQIPQKVLSLFLLFFKTDDVTRKSFLVQAIFMASIRHPDFLINSELKAIFFEILADGTDHLYWVKLRLLKGLEEYFVEEKSNGCEVMDWETIDLKTMDDVSSGMSSVIAQTYLKDVLHAYLSRHVDIRKASSAIAVLILEQGHVNPVNIVSYLIAMSTDPDEGIAKKSEQMLRNISIRYSSFISTRVSSGLMLSFELQKLLQKETVRGYIQSKSSFTSVNLHLYRLMNKNRQQRRCLILNILRNFDNSTEVSREYLQYLAGNLAYFPFSHLDEVLFLLYNINTISIISGTNILQKFQNELLKGDDGVSDKLPEDTSKIVKLLEIGEGCVLISKLKEYLEKIYQINHLKGQEYNPEAPVKIFEKPAKRRVDSQFVADLSITSSEGTKEEILKRVTECKCFLAYMLAGDVEEFRIEDYLDATKTENKVEEEVEILEPETPPPVIKTSSTKRKKSSSRKSSKKKRKGKRVVSSDDDDD